MMTTHAVIQIFKVLNRTFICYQPVFKRKVLLLVLKGSYFIQTRN